LGIVIGLISFLILMSAMVSYVLQIFAEHQLLMFVFSTACMAPMAMDGAMQFIGMRKSDNPTRFATGAVFGFGAMISWRFLGPMAKLALAFLILFGVLVLLYLEYRNSNRIQRGVLNG
jgi:uncharacterized membrane protein